MMSLAAVNHLFILLRWLIPSVFSYYYIIIWQTLNSSITFGVTETIIADVVPPQHRSTFLGISHAVYQISAIILPQVSIHLDPRVAFPSTTALAATSVLFACFMPETLLEKYHTIKKFSWSNASPMKSFSLLLRYRILTLVALVMFILGFTLDAAVTLVDSAIGFRFPTSATFQANQRSIVGGTDMLNVTVVQYLLLRYFSQRQVMIISTLCLLVSIIGSATLTAAWQVYLWIAPISAVGIFGLVAAQIVSQHVEHDEFGSAMTAIYTLEQAGVMISSQLCLPLYLFWNPPPGTDGLSAGGSMTYFPQILFGTICGILCIMVWQLEPPSEGEKVDYRRVKKRKERQAAIDREVEAAAQAAAAQSSDRGPLGSQSMSINEGGSDIHASAVSVNVSTMSSMRESLLDSSQQDQLLRKIESN